MVKKPQEKSHTVYEDCVTTIYQNGKPIMEVRKLNGHDIFFKLSECHGGSIRDLLQDMVMDQETLLDKKPIE